MAKVPSAMAKVMAAAREMANGNGKAEIVSEGISARQKFLCSDSEIRGLATGGILIRKMRMIYRWKAMEVGFPIPLE